jgi:hypothetical protein
MHLWRDWGIDGTGMGTGRGGEVGIEVEVGVDVPAETAVGQKRTDVIDKENRWRRAWILSESRRAVRKWVAQREGVEIAG